MPAFHSRNLKFRSEAVDSAVADESNFYSLFRRQPLPRLSNSSPGSKAGTRHQALGCSKILLNSYSRRLTHHLTSTA